MTSPSRSGTFDFDLHGIVGVRLVDATEHDLATVTRQLGPLRSELAREPDIIIRFADTATRSPLTYVGVGDTGFNGEGFFVLRGTGGTTAKARMPFHTIGQVPEIVCERRMPSVPHLLALINLTAISRGVLPLHASAFALDSVGVLVTGWSKGGKTETLLAAMSRGATYIGDEWVYLKPDGSMFGLPEPIRVWDWHLRQLPELLGARSRRDQMRLSTWRALDSLVAAGSQTGFPGASLARRAQPVVQRQRYLQVPPAELFGASGVQLHGHLDAVVLVLSHQSPDIETTLAGPTEVSGRMAASLEDERATFTGHYRQFQFAFPDRSNALVDTAALVESRLLKQLFDGRQAAKVMHPHPCDIAALGEAVLEAALEATAAAPGEGVAL